MEEKEMLLKEIKELIADSQKETVTSKELNERCDAINKMIAEKIDGNDHKAYAELNEAVSKLTVSMAELAGTVKSMGEKPTPQAAANTRKSLRQAVEDAMMEHKSIFVEKHDDNGKRLSMKDYFERNGNKQTPVFTLKAVDMLESNIVQANIATVRLTELDPQRVGIPLTIYPHVTEWMPSRGISRPTMSVQVAYSYSDGAGTKTEGSAPGQSSLLFKTVEFKSFTISTYGTVSDETMDDLPELLDEVSIVFPDKIMDNIDSQILGTAGDDSSALAGLGTSTKHTDWVGTSYAAAIEGANMIDLINLMAAQGKAAKQKMDAVIMHPDEVIKLGQIKDLLNNSISDRRITFDSIGRPVFVCGLRIFETTGVATNTMFVVDSSKLLIGKRKDMTMEIGYNGTDLTEGQKTIVFKTRVAFAVRDKAGVIYSSDVATDWNALIKV